MAGYSNQPTVTMMPPLPPETMPYFLGIMGIFVIWFFVGIHYKLHVLKHGFPPFYVLHIKRLLGKLH